MPFKIFIVKRFVANTAFLFYSCMLSHVDIIICFIAESFIGTNVTHKFPLSGVTAGKKNDEKKSLPSKLRCNSVPVHRDAEMDAGRT